MTRKTLKFINMPNFPFFLMFSFYNILLVYEMTLWRPKQILPKIHICSRLKPVAKDIVLGFLETYFLHWRVKFDLLTLV